MQLILDFGNTFQKCAVFSDNELVSFHKFKNITLVDLKLWLIDFPKVNKSIISSVINTPEEILVFLYESFNIIEFDNNTPIPIKNNYETPNTLGKDRLAAAVAISILAPGQNALSIDTGTAIKFDFVDSNNVYQGGSISPGLYLRFKALHTFTAKLPLVDYDNIHDYIGKNTKTSILSGVMNGAMAEINAFIDYYKNEYENVNIFLTGGESIYFVDNLKSDIFAVPNLVLQGLNEILRYNDENTTI